MTRAFGRRVLALATTLAASAMLVACGDDDGVGPTPPEPLTSEARLALDEALQDAYRTYFTYETILDDVGNVEPFVAVATTELAYTAALVDLYEERGLAPPASMWNAGNVPRFTSREQACLAAEEGEVATELMFQRLLARTLPADLRQEFEAMRQTARNTHRLQFRTCIGGTIAPLTTTVSASLGEALQEEYRMFYVYDAVIRDLGASVPFVNIRDAEWVHVGALANLYVRRTLDVPASTATPANVPTYATRQAACEAAVDDELATVAMYDRLLLQALPTDVERVFENLREASLESHLPAFQQCAGSGTAPVTDAVRAAMDEAIQDEYRAYFTYEGVTDDLEPDFPFSVIRDSEESHFTALANLYTKRGVAVPESDWSLANVPRYATRIAACDAAVLGEVANIAMYDRLLALTLPVDVRQVFESLRAASNDRHLPAFTACGS